jgi:hypothetical protein
MAHYASQSATLVSLFTDVTYTFGSTAQPVWYLDYVCIGKLNNIISGYPDGSFKPDKNINFVEAAKIITKGLGGDVAVSDPWYKGYVEKLADNGAIPTTITAFAQEITRGEMAEIIYRIKSTASTLPSQTYTDLK